MSYEFFLYILLFNKTKEKDKRIFVDRKTYFRKQKVWLLGTRNRYGAISSHSEEKKKQGAKKDLYFITPD